MLPLFLPDWMDAKPETVEGWRGRYGVFSSAASDLLILKSEAVCIIPSFVFKRITNKIGPYSRHGRGFAGLETVTLQSTS